MTEAEVVKLIGDPDAVKTFNGVMSTRYQLTPEDVWIVAYIEGRVHVAFRQVVAIDNMPTTPTLNLQASAPPTMLNPKVIVGQQD